MFGEKLELITMQCCVCRTWFAVSVDRDDLDQHLRHGVLVQDAFARRDRKPYLTRSERELFISACCDSCWHLLCPSDKLAYN
jgi:hypothetical protein